MRATGVPRWKHLRALMLPVTVLVLVPAAILSTWGFPAPAWTTEADLAMLAAGVLLAALGLALMAWTIGLVARVGRGTLAPWDPTTRLVIRGPYRHVRNPMILGVLLVLAGECLASRSRPLAVWALAALAMNLVYMPLLEEPGLERRFGEEYRAYKRNVRAWLPRVRPWDPERED